MHRLRVAIAAILAATAFADSDGTVATLRGSVAQAQAMRDLNSTLAVPDESTGFDEPGPYLEEPSENDAERPQHAKEGWEYVKCGTTVHWRGCGWTGGSYYPPSWRPSNGWRRSGFCDAARTRGDM